MFFFNPLNAVAVYIMFAVVLSIAQEDVKKAFTARRTTPRSTLKSGSASVLSTHNKVKKPVPKDLSTIAATRKGTIIVSPINFDHDYLTPITVGGQILNVVFDT